MQIFALERRRGIITEGAYLVHIVVAGLTPVMACFLIWLAKMRRHWHLAGALVSNFGQERGDWRGTNFVLLRRSASNVREPGRTHSVQRLQGVS